YPVTFLFIEMPPETFDINVHPAKKEVRFHDGHSVREAIVHAVATALQQATSISSGHLPNQNRGVANYGGTNAPSQHIAEQPSLIPTPQQAALRHDWANLPIVQPSTTSLVSPTTSPTATSIPPGDPPENHANVLVKAASGETGQPNHEPQSPPSL